MPLSSIYYKPFVFGRRRILRIVEGVFDKIRIGVDSAAIFKKKMSPEQFKLLVLLKPSEVYLLLDSDAYGTALGIAEQFSPFVSKIKVIRFPPKIDAADLGRFKVKKLEAVTRYSRF
jgi:hypothetical protein